MADDLNCAEQDDRNKVKEHYEGHSASSYEAAYFYSENEYTKYLIKLVQDTLHLRTKDPAKGHDETSQCTLNHGSGNKRLLLDIGGGTGNFTKAIIHNTDVDAIVVDPFLPPQTNVLKHGAQDSDGEGRLMFIQKSAEDFKIDSRPSGGATDENDSWKRGYHQVLIKETVHHLNEADRVQIFKGVLAGYTPDSDVYDADDDQNPPNLLIITRPQHEIDYPLWEEARQVWAQNQPAAQDIMKDLEDAGFVNVRPSTHSYPCEIPLKRWQKMIQQRFWSTFANFSDEELQEACQRIEIEIKSMKGTSDTTTSSGRLDAQGNLHFEDRLLFITANSSG